MTTRTPTQPNVIKMPPPPVPAPADMSTARRGGVARRSPSGSKASRAVGSAGRERSAAGGTDAKVNFWSLTSRRGVAWRCSAWPHRHRPRHCFRARLVIATARQVCVEGAGAVAGAVAGLKTNPLLGTRSTARQPAVEPSVKNYCRVRLEIFQCFSPNITDGCKFMTEKQQFETTS